MESKFRKSWIRVYDGSTEGLKKLVPKKSFIDSGWNRASNLPVETNHDIFVHPDQSDVPQKYIKVIYSEHKSVVTFSTSNFIWE